MRQNQITLQLHQLLGRNAFFRQQAKAGINAVSSDVARQNLLNRLRRCVNRIIGRFVQTNLHRLLPHLAQLGQSHAPRLNNECVCCVLGHRHCPIVFNYLIMGKFKPLRCAQAIALS